MKIYSVQAGSLGTNCYMITSDEDNSAAIIDPAAFVPEYATRIDELGLDLKYIFLTHGHADHTGGVIEFWEKYSNAKLAAGKHERELLLNNSANFSEEITGDSYAFIPDIWLAEGDEITLGDITLSIIETPGHTAGGISILANNETLFSGDTLFRASIGRTDLPTANYQELISSIKDKLFVLDEDISVLPGHMGPTTIGFEKNHNPFIE